MNTRESRRDSMLRKVLAIEILDLYAQGAVGQDLLALLPEITPGQQAYIKTPQGLLDLAEWAKTYRETLAALLSFRADLAGNPGSIDASDIQKVDTAADRMLLGLSTWLESSPEWLAKSPILGDAATMCPGCGEVEIVGLPCPRACNAKGFFRDVVGGEG